MLFLLFVWVLVATANGFEEPDFSRFIAWGPGLRADFSMPVRYFYIQAVDTESNKLAF